MGPSRTSSRRVGVEFDELDGYSVQPAGQVEAPEQVKWRSSSQLSRIISTRFSGMSGVEKLLIDDGLGRLDNMP